MCKTKKELDKLVVKKRKLSVLKKKIDAALDKINDEIEAYAKAKGTLGGEKKNTYIVYGDDYKVSCVIVSSARLDEAKIKEFFGDKVSDYQKTITYPRIYIS